MNENDIFWSAKLKIEHRRGSQQQWMALSKACRPTIVDLSGGRLSRLSQDYYRELELY
jgi:hypothetical protein